MMTAKSTTLPLSARGHSLLDRTRGVARLQHLVTAAQLDDAGSGECRKAELSDAIDGGGEAGRATHRDQSGEGVSAVWTVE